MASPELRSHGLIVFLLFRRNALIA